MPIYEYTALKDNKVIVKGRIEAEDSRKARRQLADQGLIPTKIEEFGINTFRINSHPIWLKDKLNETNIKDIFDIL